MDMVCQQCLREFSINDRVASMSGSIMGDEYTDSYFLCHTCRLYSVVSWRDNFTGVETVRVSGPVPFQEGETRVALIRQCKRPWDKKCRCEAHRAYFGSALD